MGPSVAIWLCAHSGASLEESAARAAILLDEEATSLDTLHVWSTVAIGGETTLREPRPFGLAPGDVGLDDPDLAAVETRIHIRPTSALHAFAYGNQRSDHLVLGEIALFLARTVDGLVDFGGSLGAIAAPRGRLIAIPYAGSSLGERFHIGDADFLAWWLHSEDFHLVK